MSVSTRTLLNDGVLKRADALKIRFADLKVKPGFNVRIENDDFNESVEALADHIYAGGDYPPLLVRFDGEGNAWIVDGHRRRASIEIAIGRGAPIEWIDIKKFEGNDVDALAATITTAEGRSLSPLEMAGAVKRLIAFGLSSGEVAAKIGKTPARVDQLMLLANANHDVQAMVKAGDVSASIASETVRKHGDNAGAVLAEQKAEAAAAGKKKVTAGTIKKAKKEKPADDQRPELAQAVFDLVDGMPEGELRTLAEIEEGRRTLGTIMIDGRALANIMRLAGCDYRTLDMFKQPEGQ